MTFPTPTASPRSSTLDCLRVSKVWARRSLLCSDIVGFTSLLSRLGDTAALEIVRRHDAIVRAALAAHGGEERELRGDGFFISFQRRADALACAVEIQRALALDRARHADGGLHVRIAVHTAEFLMERTRYFGIDVVIPFRLLDVAEADGILVSVAPGDDELGLPLLGGREVSLKGIPAPVTVSELDSSSARTDAPVWAAA
jgi:class 3 adenylate cyclase